MYASSNGRANPRIKEKPDRLTLNSAREKICRKSPIWSKDFDLAAHRAAWEAGEQRRRALRRKNASATTHLAPPRPAFNGRLFACNRSYVLSCETIFCPSFASEKGSKANIAPWPARAEAKYEGDDRISTDALHGRFPGAPRVEAEDSTVNWQLRAVVEQFPFDDFYFPVPCAVEVFMRSHWIAELEVGEEEGKEVLGGELWEALDPTDQW